MTRTLTARTRTRFGRILIGAWLVGGFACSDVTEPNVPAEAPAVASRAQAVPAGMGAEIEDALDRVLPAMSDEAGSKGVEAALRALVDALSRGETGAAIASIESAGRALEAFERGVGPADGDAVHVEVIALALASVRAQVAGN